MITKAPALHLTQTLTRLFVLVVATISFIVLWPLSFPIAGLALIAVGIIRFRSGRTPIGATVAATGLGALILITSLVFGATFFAARTNVIAPTQGTPITH